MTDLAVIRKKYIWLLNQEKQEYKKLEQFIKKYRKSADDLRSINDTQDMIYNIDNAKNFQHSKEFLDSVTEEKLNQVIKDYEGDIALRLKIEGFQSVYGNLYNDTTVTTSPETESSEEAVSNPVPEEINNEYIELQQVIGDLAKFDLVIGNKQSIDDVLMQKHQMLHDRFSELNAQYNDCVTIKNLYNEIDNLRVITDAYKDDMKKNANTVKQDILNLYNDVKNITNKITKKAINFEKKFENSKNFSIKQDVKDPIDEFKSSENSELIDKFASCIEKYKILNIEYKTLEQGDKNILKDLMFNLDLFVKNKMMINMDNVVTSFNVVNDLYNKSSIDGRHNITQFLIDSNLLYILEQDNNKLITALGKLELKELDQSLIKKGMNDGIKEWNSKVKKLSSEISELYVLIDEKKDFSNTDVPVFNKLIDVYNECDALKSYYQLNNKLDTEGKRIFEDGMFLLRISMFNALEKSQNLNIKYSNGEDVVRELTTDFAMIKEFTDQPAVDIDADIEKLLGMNDAE